MRLTNSARQEAGLFQNIQTVPLCWNGAESLLAVAAGSRGHLTASPAMVTGAVAEMPSTLPPAVRGIGPHLAPCPRPAKGSWHAATHGAPSRAVRGMGRNHAARQFWHARLTPFTRSHRSRATRARLPCLPRPALSLRGWRPGAGRTPAAHTRRLQSAPRSPTDRRGATNTKDEALLLRMRQLGSDDSSEAPGGSATRRATGAALADPSGLSGQAHNYEAAKAGIMMIHT